MCGRFTRSYTWAQLHALYSLNTPPASNLQPRYNICPTTPIDTVVENAGVRTLETMRWGIIPRWFGKPLKEWKVASFNARVETVTTKPAFKEAFRRHRCLIPASGYYEWQDTPDGKQPYHFTRRDGELITIAGIWDEWRNPETKELLHSCAMIIGAPNRFVAEVHDRMPMILEKDQFAPWLSGAAGLEALKPAAEDVLERCPVSRRVNSAKASDEDQTLIDTVPLAEPTLV